MELVQRRRLNHRVGIRAAAGADALVHRGHEAVLVVFARPLPLVLTGALLWGVGASLGFPIGMSAAGDDPVDAAPRVSVVSSIGYSAFFAGPPLIGFLAGRAGILISLLAVLVALAVAVLTSSATRPLGPD